MTTSEERLAKHFGQVVSNIDFSPEKFSYYLGNESPHVQAVAVRVGLNVTENIVALVKRGCNDPEYGLAMWLADELKLGEE